MLTNFIYVVINCASLFNIVIILFDNDINKMIRYVDNYDCVCKCFPNCLVDTSLLFSSYVYMNLNFHVVLYDINQPLYRGPSRSLFLLT